MSNFTPSSDNLLLGRGSLYIAPFVNGEPDGEFHLGNVTSFSLSTSDEVKEKYESMTHNSALYDATLVKRTITTKAVGDEFSTDNLALNLMGSIVNVTQTSGSAADETITTSAKLGKFYPTKFRNISNVVVTVGAETKAAGTDYTVDATTGRIYIVPTGSIAAGATVLVDYDYSTVNLQAIEGGTVGNIYASIRFIGDPAKGPKYEVIIPKVQITPDGELGLISDDYGQWSLSGRVLTVPGEAPYKVIRLA